MQLTNSRKKWGLFAILFHWLSLLLVVGLYALGWYMVELDYYDPWYRSAPFWHKSFGLLLFAVILLRLLNRFFSETPEPVPGHRKAERLAAKGAHVFLYVLLLVVMVSGYLISTADGRGISVFSWFEIPALVTEISQQEDRAGLVHYWATHMLVALGGFHGLAALKHHFYDRDNTLLRMLP